MEQRAMMPGEATKNAPRELHREHRRWRTIYNIGLNLPEEDTPNMKQPKSPETPPPSTIV
jgi:hypothetical protein